MKEEIAELVLQALETEMGGVQIYETALECAVNKELKEEWEKYLEQTKRHVEIVEELCSAFGLDPEKETPGRKVVHHIGESLVKAINMAKKAGDAQAAQIVACECVVLAETKDHLNWELLTQLSKDAKGSQVEKLRKACDEVEEQEDVHLYHTRGWARELWMDGLGMAAVLPPPEEEQNVKTAIAAARAQQSRRP
jgi:rubrerythrin